MVQEINFYSRKEEYGWLSNFWRCKQIVGSMEYPTNEHFYQSQKAKDVELELWIAEAPTPYAAMKAGRSLRQHEMVDNWDTKKVSIMLKGLRAKFQNPELRQKLLDTGDALLCEDSPNDLFWGKRGMNVLGILLMELRQEIKNVQTDFSN